jgi:hypothetical protein
MSLPLLQEVLTHLIARQLPLLVIYSADVGLLQELHVEADQLLREGSNRGDSAQASHPGKHVAEAGLQRRWQPICTAAAVVEPRRAVARVTLPTMTADSPPCQQRLMNPLPSMGELSSPHHLAGGIVDERKPSGLATRVNLEAQWLWLGIRYRALEDDREGVAAPHGCFLTREQLPCPCRVTRCQRLLLCVYYKDHSVALSGYHWLPR